MLAKDAEQPHMPNEYMAREKLETKLDSMFADSLTSPSFLRQCVETMRSRYERNDSAARIQRLTQEIGALRQKRNRVIDGFVEGVIEREERDRRLAAIDQEIHFASEIILRETPEPAVNGRTLIEAFAPLMEWEHWTRDQKRLVLSTLVPDIRVANYQIESVGLVQQSLASAMRIPTEPPLIYLPIHLNPHDDKCDYADGKRR